MYKKISRAYINMLYNRGATVTNMKSFAIAAFQHSCRLAVCYPFPLTPLYAHSAQSNKRTRSKKCVCVPLDTNDMPRRYDMHEPFPSSAACVNASLWCRRHIDRTMVVDADGDIGGRPSSWRTFTSACRQADP